MSPSTWRALPAALALALALPLSHVVGLSLPAATTRLLDEAIELPSSLQAPVGEASRQLLSSRASFADRKSCEKHGKVFRCFPDIMFVGQSKAGTTSISMYLIQHPKVLTQSLVRAGTPLANMKIGNKPIGYEVHAFDHHLRSERAILASHWKTCPLLHAEDVNEKLQLHYTPNYMYFPDAPFHIKNVYPNARSIKYIMMLRQPTKRTVSSWEFHKQVTLESRSFTEAMRQGMNQRRALESCYQEELLKLNASAKLVTDLPQGPMGQVVNMCFWGRADTHDTTIPMELPITLMHAHVDKSVYVDQIRRWHALLGRENFFIFSLEEWIKDQRKVFSQMLDFVGLEEIGPNGFPSEEALNKTLSVRYNEDSKKGSVRPDEEVVKELDEFFKPYDKELFELLGRKLW